MNILKDMEKCIREQKEKENDKLHNVKCITKSVFERSEMHFQGVQRSSTETEAPEGNSMLEDRSRKS